MSVCTWQWFFAQQMSSEDNLSSVYLHFVKTSTRLMKLIKKITCYAVNLQIEP